MIIKVSIKAKTKTKIINNQGHQEKNQRKFYLCLKYLRVEAPHPLPRLLSTCLTTKEPPELCTFFFFFFLISNSQLLLSFSLSSWTTQMFVTVPVGTGWKQSPLYPVPNLLSDPILIHILSHNFNYPWSVIFCH